jgi:hypothetical protein
VLEDLLAWNLQLDGASDPAARSELYNQRLAEMKRLIARVSWNAADRQIAEALLANAGWLITQNDPLDEAWHFAAIAEELSSREKTVPDPATRAEFSRWRQWVADAISANMQKVDRTNLTPSQTDHWNRLRLYSSPATAPGGEYVPAPVDTRRGTVPPQPSGEIGSLMTPASRWLASDAPSRNATRPLSLSPDTLEHAAHGGVPSPKIARSPAPLPILANLPPRPTQPDHDPRDFSDATPGHDSAPLGNNDAVKTLPREPLLSVKSNAAPRREPPPDWQTLARTSKGDATSPTAANFKTKRIPSPAGLMLTLTPETASPQYQDVVFADGGTPPIQHLYDPLDFGAPADVTESLSKIQPPDALAVAIVPPLPGSEMDVVSPLDGTLMPVFFHKKLASLMAEDLPPLPFDDSSDPFPSLTEPCPPFLSLYKYKCVTINITATSVPEPLSGIGLTVSLGLILLLRRRRIV